MLDDAQSWQGDLVSEVFFDDLFTNLSRALDEQHILALPEPNGLAPGDIALALQYKDFDFSSSIYVSWLKNRRPRVDLHPNLQNYLIEERLPTSLEFSFFNEALSEPIRIRYPYTMMVGADLSTNLSIFGLRIEACYMHNKTFAQQYLQSTTSPYVSLAFALDTLIGENLIALEGRAYRYLDLPTQGWLVAPQSFQFALLGQWTLSLQNKLQLISQYDTARNDLMMQLQIQHAFNDSLTLSLQGAWFQGEALSNPLAYEGGIFGNWQAQRYIQTNLQWKQ